MNPELRDATDEAENDRPERRPRSLRFLLVLGVTVVIGGVVAAVAYDHWLTHPNALMPESAIVGVDGPVTVDQSYAQDTSIGTQDGHDVIRLDRVRPNVTKNTANAAITMELCRHRPGINTIGTELLNDNTSRECLSLAPVAHQSVALGELTTQLVAVITPTCPGTIWVSGFTVSYHQGRRHETQSGGIQLHWTATAPK